MDLVHTTVGKTWSKSRLRHPPGLKSHFRLGPGALEREGERFHFGYISGFPFAEEPDSDIAVDLCSGQKG